MYLQQNSLLPRDEEHPYVAAVLSNMALLYKTQERYVEAKPLYKRALTIWEKIYGPEHPYVVTTLSDLAEIHEVQCKYVEAQSLYIRTLRIYEKAPEQAPSDLVDILQRYELLLREVGKKQEAKLIEERVRKMDVLRKDD